jgi:hypothetical protein
MMTPVWLRLLTEKRITIARLEGHEQMLLHVVSKVDGFPNTANVILFLNKN